MKTVRAILYQVFSLLYFLVGFGQKIPLQKVGSLNDDIEECSGIAYLPSGNLAMINDSGNGADVFITDLKGNIITRKCLIEITNNDWEELTYDDGFLYIGDFGNNRNKREDLTIYRYMIDDKDSMTYYGEIHFKYADQKHFPPDSDYRNYDLEAMVHMNDSIFIFTKNRTEPFTGYTYQYGMPDEPGSYTLSRLDSFKTGYGKEEFFWIAGAALNKETGTLALLGYDKIWLFNNYNGSRFLSGESETISFEFLSQKEAVTFVDKNELIITDERNRFGGGDVYYASLPEPAIAQHEIQPFDTAFFNLRIQSEEITDSIVVIFPEFFEGKLLWEIFNTKGERVLAGNNTMAKDEQLFVIDTKALKPGGYVLNVIIEDHPHAFKVKKLYPIKKNK